MIQVTWMDRKGAGRMRAFEDGERAADFLSRLRAEATARDSEGNIVGGANEVPEFERRDRGTKWAWWIDTEAK